MTTLENIIERFEHNAEFERRNGNLQGCLEFRQLAEWLKDYKRLLEQEPCDDAISRDAACKMICAEFVNPQDGMQEWRNAVNDVVENILHKVEQLPSVTQKSGKWIPVSERLPEIADVYRVTRYYPNNVMNPKYLVDACAFDGSNIWYNDNRINHERGYANNVIAWQENPEPYEPRESEG